MMKSNIHKTLLRRKVIVFSLAAAGIAAGSYFLKNNDTPTDNLSANVSFSENTRQEKIEISEFNPNELDAKQWQQLGFSEKQTATILKFKDVVGGEFTSKEQFKKCYAVSDEMYQQLEKFILLPEKEYKNNYASKNSDYHSASYHKKDISVYRKFNPDLYSQKDWQNLGFSEKQSAAILKYKDYLGGSFVSKDKFRECFIISEENFAKLAPYLILPEHSPHHVQMDGFSAKSERPNIVYHNFDPNLIDLDGWKSLGFSEKQANVILNYKNRNLKGSFKNLEEIKACFVISEEKFNELKPYIKLNPENFSVITSAKNTYEPTAETKTDFSKIDINQITYRQLMEFGFDEKSAGMLVGFRKKLGGFVNENQILETYDIDKDLAQKLVSTAKLNTSGIAKYTLVNAPEEWLKNHPYFKYSADKIIYYRTTNPDENKIWKFIKVKPEYEAKMRMYLK